MKDYWSQKISNQKRRVKWHWMLLLVSVWGIMSCSTEPSCGTSPEVLLDKMERVVEQCKEEKTKENTSKLEALDKTFAYYVENCFDQWRSEMTGAERRKFWTLSTKYLGLRMGQNIGQWFKKKENEDADTDWESILQELKAQWKKEGKDSMLDLKSEIDRTFSDIIEEIEDL